jgi:beta-aspartyl-peptidase (threonine type)
LGTLLACLVFLVASLSAQPASPEQQIRQVLNDQVAAWNRGDLEAFMAGYWHSPDLTFFSNSAETKGWDGALARYQQNYKSAGHAMGKLDFPMINITVLSSDTAFVRGQFHLVLPDGKEPHGMFTLIVRKFPEGWRIIHDHSSS